MSAKTKSLGTKAPAAGKAPAKAKRAPSPASAKATPEIPVPEVIAAPVAEPAVEVAVLQAEPAPLVPAPLAEVEPLQAEPVIIDMGTMAQQVFQELAATEPERTIHLNLHPIPPALGTEAMIKQLWINLIGNAVKFTMKREVAKIEIGVMPGEQGDHGDEGEQIYFIRDNGAGFDMRYVDKLFGVFQRLHSKEEFPGTGVGLALVQRIINRHGGRIWAKGEVEKGATFFFTIPAVGKQTTTVKEPTTKSTP